MQPRRQTAQHRGAQRSKARHPRGSHVKVQRTLKKLGGKLQYLFSSPTLWGEVAERLPVQSPRHTAPCVTGVRKAPPAPAQVPFHHHALGPPQSLLPPSPLPWRNIPTMAPLRLNTTVNGWRGREMRQRYDTCFASVRSWVHSLAPNKMMEKWLGR